MLADRKTPDPKIANNTAHLVEQFASLSEDSPLHRLFHWAAASSVQKHPGRSRLKTAFQPAPKGREMLLANEGFCILPKLHKGWQEGGNLGKCD